MADTTGAKESPQERSQSEAAYRAWLKRQAATSAPLKEGETWQEAGEYTGIDHEEPNE